MIKIDIQICLKKTKKKKKVCLKEYRKTITKKFVQRRRKKKRMQVKNTWMKTKKINGKICLKKINKNDRISKKLISKFAWRRQTKTKEYQKFWHKNMFEEDKQKHWEYSKK